MKKSNLYILIILILYLLTGCRNQSNQKVKYEKKEKAPSSLKNIANDIQEILTTAEHVEKLIDKTYLDEKNLREEEKESQQGGHDSNSSQGNSNTSDKGKQQEDGNNQEGNKPKTPEEKNMEEEEKRQEHIMKSWQSMSKKIENIHKSWNSYEVEEKKSNLSIDKIEQFRISLNSLTQSIENKDVMKVYEYGSQSLLNISPMFELYKDDLGGEINKIKHGVYLAYLRFTENKALQGSDILKQLDNSINNMKLKLGEDKDKIKIIDKVSLSIEDMEKTMKEDSLKLIRIKRDIIIKNLQELEK